MERRRDRASWRRIGTVYGLMAVLGIAGAAGVFRDRLDGDLRIAFAVGAVLGLVGVAAAVRGLSRM
jgi:hypothetical protein